MRVLLIDDDAVRAYARTVLGRAGFEVAEARDGLDGLDLYRREGADLVITDVFMPGRDGLEVVREFASRFPGVPVIAMSGGGQGGDLDMLPIAGHLGAAAVLRKPFKPSELLNAVGRILGQVPPA